MAETPGRKCVRDIAIASTEDDGAGSHDEEFELKEFITLPVFVTEDPELRNKRRHQSRYSCFHVDAETNTSKHVTVDDGVLPNVIGSQLITRRMSIVGGFLDIALFSANCEQLKFVLELGKLHVYYDEVVALLIASLVLQLMVALTMFLLGALTIKKARDETYSNCLNHITMGLVALITIVNIFIGTFGPKGTVMAKCLGAFAYPNLSGSHWFNYLNSTRNYMLFDGWYLNAKEGL